jgi:hypothetical protein
VNDFAWSSDGQRVWAVQQDLCSDSEESYREWICSWRTDSGQPISRVGPQIYHQSSLGFLEDVIEVLAYDPSNVRVFYDESKELPLDLPKDGSSTTSLPRTPVEIKANDFGWLLASSTARLLARILWVPPGRRWTSPRDVTLKGNCLAFEPMFDSEIFTILRFPYGQLERVLHGSGE